MSSSDDTAKVGLGPAYVGTDIGTDLSTDGLALAVQEGAKGGDSTVAFFNDINSFGQMLTGAASSGMDAWTKSNNPDGLPIYYMELDDGNGDSYTVEVNMLGLTVTGTGDTATVETTGGTITVNGKTYNVIGYKALTLSYKGTHYKRWLWAVGLLSGGTALLTAVKPVLAAAIDSITSNFTTQLSTVASIDTTDGAEIDTTLANAEADADTDIATDAAVEVATDVVVADVAVATLGFIGVGLAVAAACVVVAVLIHNSHQTVKLYNFSRYRLKWSAYFAEGGFMQCPGTLNSDGNVVNAYLIDPVHRTGVPDDANPTPKVYCGDFSVDSLSEWHGLGYAIKIQFMPANIKDPQDSDAVYTCTLMFDIPYAGQNSTSVTFDAVSDLSTFYSDNEGVNCSTVQSASSSDGVITVTTTYDYLTGEHPSPTDPNKTGYYYQSLIQITDTGLNP